MQAKQQFYLIWVMKFAPNERHHWIYKGDYEDWFDKTKQLMLSN
jgi:hypothetical protein